MNNLENEIAEIRSQLNRQKWFVGVSVVGWIGGFTLLLMGAADISPIKNLRVSRLALVDAKGIERLILDADNSHVTINGKVYKRQSPISGIILQNAKGDEMGGMGTTATGQANIALDSYSTKAPGITDRIGFLTKPDGTAAFMLMDVEGNQRAGISSGSDMDVKLELSGQDGQPRISGTVRANGTSIWSDGSP